MDTTVLTHAFDDRLFRIEHYQRYPKMAVAVGDQYITSPCKILILGESHYLNRDSTVSNTPQAWYPGLALGDIEQRHISTRGIVRNVVLGKNPSKSKAIYHALDRAFGTAALFDSTYGSAFRSIAFMNFFQRPAEVPKESIKVHPADVTVAASVLREVVTTIQPALIVFASRLAWRHALAGGLVADLRALGVTVDWVPHPATAWWNRSSKRYGGRTGRQKFLEMISTAVKDKNSGQPAPDQGRAFQEAL
jgi:hypothetical protein